MPWCLYTPETCFGTKIDFSWYFLTMPIFGRKWEWKLMWWPRPNMGSTSTPRQNQRHKQVPRAYRRSTISFFSGQQALHRLTVRNFVLNALSSGTALARSGMSSGTLWHALALAMRALRGLAKGHNGFLWSCKVLIHILEAYTALWKSCQSVPERDISWFAITSNRITSRVSVLCRQPWNRCGYRVFNSC